ncbi:MAG: calcium-binding protein, partial [Planctomycetales bacterium]|nr:calcium-binding protein [Planctomycetales bacterium]
MTLGQEVIDGVTYTTIAPNGVYDGTPIDLQLFWGGDLGSDFIADRYYGYDFNLGLGNGSVDLGTNPNIKVTGTPGNDIVRNNSGNGVGTALELTAYGHGGNDEFYGGQKYDKLIGGPGKDKLFGMGGDDVLYGGVASDNDELTGGTGEDRFYIRSTDVNKELGVGTVKDKHKLDSRVHLVDTPEGLVWYGKSYGPNAWSDAEFETIDTVFNNFSDTTDSQRLMQSPTGTDIYQYRLGAWAGNPDDNGAWTDGGYSAYYPKKGLAVDNIVHEVLGHNYDHPMENQFNQAFRDISGWTDERPISFLTFENWKTNHPTGDYVGFVESESKDGKNWFYANGIAKKDLFYRDYGAHSPEEDFAVASEAWYKSEILKDSGINVIQSKQANLQKLFDFLGEPTTPSDLRFDQSVNINRPIFNWESLVADSFRVQIKDASNNVKVDLTTAELTLSLTADLPAGTYTFLVSSMIDTEEESPTASINFTVNHAPEWVAGVQPPPM